jgi:hypothetical protein
MPLSQEIIDKAAAVLQEWGNEATAQMQKLLNERLKRTAQESQLSQSIDWTGSEVTPDGATAVWNLDDYYVYVDLGVKGVNNKSKTYTSDEFPAGFQFRNIGTPPAMVNAMQNYIARKGIQVTPKEGETVIDASFRMAKAMSIAVKKKGIDGTRFYSDVFNDYGFKRLTDKLSAALGTEIEINITTELKTL